jgi:long-subunit fatty acid transport protein
MTQIPIRAARTALAAALGAAGTLAAGSAGAGGLMLYEVGTEDVGLASAGYTARAQDASTVFTNPAGMTRLEGNQLTLGAQVLYGNVGFTVGQGTSPDLGGGDGGMPIGWFPGGGFFYSYSVSPDLKLGFAATGNFGVAYDSAFQDSSNVSPALPANAVSRFGIGGQKEESRTFSWGVAAEYAAGGTLDVNHTGSAPVIVGGRGDLVARTRTPGSCS